MTRPPPSFLSATHVTYDPLTPERLSNLGATNIVRACHRLVITPGHGKAKVHTPVRRAWWHSATFKKWDHLYSLDVRWEMPVVLWVSTSIVERVDLWRTCSWLRHLGVATRDVLILEFDKVPSGSVPKEPPPPFDHRWSVPDHPDDVLLERSRTARPWPRARYDRAVRLWDQYVDADPSRFLRSCTRGVPGFPELPPLWTFLSAFFPRRAGDGALRLSRFDELLLTILSGEWQTPLNVYVHKSQAGDELMQWLSATGDLFLADRLVQWARHGSRAVEREAGPRRDVKMMSSVYRLTEAGRRLRDKGLQQLSDAPPLPVAGIEAYAPSSPWVLAKGGELVRL